MAWEKQLDSDMTAIEVSYRKQGILGEISQGSVLGPLLCLIFISDLEGNNYIT